MKRYFHLLLIPAFCALLAATCGREEQGGEDLSAWTGVQISEIAAHDQTADENSWVELSNPTESDIDISGLGLYLWDEYFSGRCLWSAPEGTVLKKGERLVLTTADEGLNTGISSAAEFTLKLATATGGAVDSFTRSEAFKEPAACYGRGSYQRIPDGSATWRNMTYNSRGKENKVFSLDDYNRVAVWVWSSHISDLMDNDAANLRHLKEYGYDHIILNYAAFASAKKKTTVAFLDKAEELGLAVHAWIQCFYNGSWVSPVDDENNCYKEDLYADIRARAKSYLEDFGVIGLHLDYIRFGGTAYKHNPSAQVTAVGAVNKCCSELREIIDSYDEGMVTSAALMPEEGGAYYYGQNPDLMGKYIHILMPMIYKYSYGYSDATCAKRGDYFASNTGGAECWAGTTTYVGNDSGVKPMDAEGILHDCEVYKGTKVKGIVLFRYQLGTFPDLSRFWN